MTERRAVALTALQLSFRGTPSLNVLCGGSEYVCRCKNSFQGGSFVSCRGDASPASTLKPKVGAAAATVACTASGFVQAVLVVS